MENMIKLQGSKCKFVTQSKLIEYIFSFKIPKR